MQSKSFYPDMSLQRGVPPVLVVEDEYRGDVVYYSGSGRNEMEVSKTISKRY